MSLTRSCSLLIFLLVIVWSCCGYDGKLSKDQSYGKVYSNFTCCSTFLSSGNNSCGILAMNYVIISSKVVSEQLQFNATIDFTLSETVNFGSVIELSISKMVHNMNIVYLDFTLNLCDLFLDLQKLQCPIKPGHYKIFYETPTLPPLIEKGVFIVKLKAKNEFGKETTCSTFDMTLM